MIKALLLTIALFTASMFVADASGSKRISSKICSSKWKPSNDFSIIAFLKNGTYKCYFNSNDGRVQDSVVGEWSLNDRIITIMFDDFTSVKGEKIALTTEVVRVDSKELVIKHMNSEFTYKSVPEIWLAPQFVKDAKKTQAERIIPQTIDGKNDSKDKTYSKFIGTYQLKKFENIEYDHMTFRIKKDNPNQLECVRKYRFKDPQTGKVGNENVQIYDVVKVDIPSKKITLKYGENEATYDFKDNDCGGYDLIVFEEVLVYSCNKK